MILNAKWLKIFSSFIYFFINMGIKFLILRRKDIQIVKIMKYNTNNSDFIKKEYNKYINLYEFILFIFKYS